MGRSVFLVLAISGLTACSTQKLDLTDCTTYFAAGFRKIADDRSHRFLGKVHEETARCRGGDRAVIFRSLPWVDWQNYWAAADGNSKAQGVSGEQVHLSPNGRGIDGALLDLEYQRIELIKFNLFDNSGTFEQYLRGRDHVGGAALKTWEAMRLPGNHPFYTEVGGDGPQLCRGDLIRARTLSGICNDIKNPLMGSAGQMFARNVEFDTSFPELGSDFLVKNRHGDRLGLLKPDPQVISRKLLTRPQSEPQKCNNGQGLASHSPEANCDYKKAPFVNVLAAFWVQFMTHDWFSHLEEGSNGAELMPMGCATEIESGVETSLTPERVKQLNCRPEDQIDKGLMAMDTQPSTFNYAGQEYLSRAPKATANKNTAWWDASQLYGFDENSRRRVKRDPRDRAKFLLVNDASGEAYLPLLQSSDPMNPQWAGQESVAFADNWSVGLSFFHNVFAREHNFFVDAFRERAAATPDA
ncbi:MAG TPA: peroxidase family protein, partial [Candidatus Binatia bacterium]